MSHTGVNGVVSRRQPERKGDPTMALRAYRRVLAQSRKRRDRYWVNLRRHTSLLGRQRRSTYREYASRRWLPRASSGSQLDPVPSAKLTWANLLRHTSLLGRQRRSTYREYASRRWLPRASSGSQLDPVPSAKL